jgi:RecA/RadA recombinase
MQKAASVVERKFGDNVLVEVASESLSVPELWVSTGSWALDRICRGFNPGGFPVGPKRGRIVHIAGEWSTAKSLILDHAFLSVLNLENGFALCSESEGTRDTYFPERIGLDLSLLQLLVAPQSIEHAFDSGLEFIKNIRTEAPDAPILWGVDSIEAMEPSRTMDTELSNTGSFQYGGGRSQALGTSFRRAVREVARHPTTLVLINQTRDDPMVLFGSKKRTPGGNAPHFFASLEIMLQPSRRGKVFGKYTGVKISKEQRKKLGMAVTEKGEMLGFWIRAQITKTKLGSTLHKECHFYLDFQKGLSKTAGLFELLQTEGLIAEKNGKVVQVVPGENGKPSGRSFESKEEWELWIAENEWALGQIQT